MPFQPLMFRSNSWVSRSAANTGCSPTFSVRKQNLQCSRERKSRRGRRPLPFTFREPSELDAFLFTVVASALFCLCCRYWAFCFQICNQIRAKQNKLKRKSERESSHGGAEWREEREQHWGQTEGRWAGLRQGLQADRSRGCTPSSALMSGHRRGF